MNDAGPIVFFDGTCGMCSWSVRWMLKHDRKAVLRFAPIQGETYANLDHAGKPVDMSSMVFVRQGKLYTRSEAVAQMLMAMGGWPAIFGIKLWAVPRPIRDWGYRMVAANRYKIAGRVERCEVPNEADRARMLP